MKPLRLLLVVAAVVLVLGFAQPAAATDGDTSTASITSFSETLTDDTLFYPDQLTNSTSQPIKSITDIAAGGNAYDYDPFTYILSKDGLFWRSRVNVTNTGYLYMNFSNPHGDALDKLDYAVFNYGGSTTILLQAYDYVAVTWDTVKDLEHGASNAWNNGSLTDHNYFSTKIMFRIWWTNPSGILAAIVDYMEVDAWYYMTLADSNHYAESFSDVSDVPLLTASAGLPAHSFTTDGDVATEQITCDDTADEWVIYKIEPSSLSINHYIEIRYRVVGAAYAHVYIEATSGAAFLFSFQTSTTWTSVRAWIPSLGALTGNIVRIRLYCNDNPDSTASGTPQTQWDYLRVFPATESGWQHDGSTTQAVSAAGGGTVSTDGDYLSMVADSDGSTFNISIDTTTTAASLEDTYYPFLSLQFHTGDSADYFRIESFDGSAYATIQAYSQIGASGLWRWNLDTVENDPVHFRVYAYGSQTIRLDWIKAFNIANFTKTITGASLTDYAYVSGTTLVVEKNTATLFQFDRDPAISVASATYGVWNITTNVKTAVGISLYVAAWTTTDDETRGAMPSGTTTDLRIRADADCTISAIKFITDATAPAILDKFATPSDPNPDDSVTISVVASDAVDIYKVVLNAVTYPAGFSDVDYVCTEQVTNSVYSYTFTTLLQGYYLFKIIAMDGANNGTYYLPVTVTTKAFAISDIVLITSTATLASVSGYSTLAASYTIYENDTNSGSGSIAASWFSFSWTKESSAGVYVRLGIKFVSGSTTLWVNGSYSVASAEVLAITDTSYTSTSTENHLSGVTNLACSYYVYDNDTYQSVTGSMAAGSFSVTWNKLTTVGLHRSAVKFNVTGTTRWWNGSYDVVSTTFLVTDVLVSMTAVEVKVSGYVNLACTYTVYENNTLMETGSLGGGNFPIDWAVSSTLGTHAWGIKFVSGSTTRWLNGSYYVAATAFSLVGNAIDVQDVWITFGFVTNQGTATFYLWDNNTYVGGSYEGFYQVAKPTTIGLHNYTILINSTQLTIDATHQTKNFGTSDLWLWQNWKYTVNPVQLSFDEVSFNQNNESVVITGRVYTSASILYYTVYEANLGYTTGTISGVTSASWLSWMWDKSSVTSTSNFTVTMTDSTYNVTFRGFYLRIAGNQWITYGSSVTEDHRTYVQNSSIIYNNPPGFFIDQGTATILAVGGVIIAMFALMVSKQILKSEILKGIRKGLSQ